MKKSRGGSKSGGRSWNGPEDEQILSIHYDERMGDREARRDENAGANRRDRDRERKREGNRDRDRKSDRSKGKHSNRNRNGQRESDLRRNKEARMLDDYRQVERGGRTSGRSVPKHSGRSPGDHYYQKSKNSSRNKRRSQNHNSSKRQRRNHEDPQGSQKMKKSGASGRSARKQGKDQQRSKSSSFAAHHNNCRCYICTCNHSNHKCPGTRGLGQKFTGRTVNDRDFKKHPSEIYREALNPYGRELNTPVDNLRFKGNFGDKTIYRQDFTGTESEVKNNQQAYRKDKAFTEYIKVSFKIIIPFCY